AEFLRELNSQVTETSDSLDGYEVTWQRAAVAQGVKRGNAGAHQRCRFGSVERFRHPRQRFHWGDHEFLIPAVKANPTNHRIRAIYEITSPARRTSSVLTTVPPDADALALLPVVYPRPRLVDHAGYFVSGHTRIRDAGKESFFGDHIAVTDATGLNADPHLSRARGRDFALHDFKVRSRFGHLHGFHFGHLSSPLSSIPFKWNPNPQ